MQRRWLTSLAPLSGAVFVVLVVLAFGVIGNSNTPDTQDSTAKVVAFYHQHYSSQIAAAILVMVAGIFMVWFTTALRALFAERNPESHRLASLVQVVGGMLAVGCFVMAGAHIALSDAVHDHVTSGVQALNALDNSIFPVILVPLFLLTTAFAAASLRYALYSRWIGIPATILAVAMVTPASWFAMILSLLVLLAVSITAFSWTRRAAAPAPAPARGDRAELLDPAAA